MFEIKSLSFKSNIKLKAHYSMKVNKEWKGLLKAFGIINFKMQEGSTSIQKSTPYLVVEPTIKGSASSCITIYSGAIDPSRLGSGNFTTADIAILKKALENQKTNIPQAIRTYLEKL